MNPKPTTICDAWIQLALSYSSQYSKTGNESDYTSALGAFRKLEDCIERNTEIWEVAKALIKARIIGLSNRASRYTENTKNYYSIRDSDAALYIDALDQSVTVMQKLLDFGAVEVLVKAQSFIETRSHFTESDIEEMLKR